jgi:hypothetical protein
MWVELNQDCTFVNNDFALRRSATANTSSIQAEKFRPDRKAFGSATPGSGSERRTDARKLIHPLAHLVGPMPGHD